MYLATGKPCRPQLLAWSVAHVQQGPAWVFAGAVDAQRNAVGNVDLDLVERRRNAWADRGVDFVRQHIGGVAQGAYGLADDTVLEPAPARVDGADKARRAQ